MELAPNQRFGLKGDMLDEFERDPQRWSDRKVNLLLQEFGCRPLSWHNDGFGFEDSIADLSDALLVEMAAVVLGDGTAQVTPRDTAEQELAETPIWKPGMVRLFLSHSAAHKRFAAEVAAALEPAGISGFVAHDSMTYGYDWQEQIQAGLRTMEAFVVLLHPEVNKSPWCQEEIGWALGSSTPYYLVRLGADPAGFIGRKQYPQVQPEDAAEVAELIVQWLVTKEAFAEPLVGGLLTSLADSASYIASIAVTEEIAKLDALTDEKWSRLDNAVLENDQVGGSVGAGKNLRPFYRRHGRSWPPAEPGRG